MYVVTCEGNNPVYISDGERRSATQNATATVTEKPLRKVFHLDKDIYESRNAFITADVSRRRTLCKPMAPTSEHTIGVLALQGSFAEHISALRRFPDVTAIEVRTPSQLQSVTALIIPGGESTAIGVGLYLSP